MEEKQIVLKEQLKNLKETNEACKSSLNSISLSKGKGSGVKNFIKRRIAKLVRWYYLPIAEEQIAINNDTIEILERLINKETEK